MREKNCNNYCKIYARNAKNTKNDKCKNARTCTIREILFIVIIHIAINARHSHFSCNLLHLSFYARNTLAMRKMREMQCMINEKCEKFCNTSNPNCIYHN